MKNYINHHCGICNANAPLGSANKSTVLNEYNKGQQAHILKTLKMNKK